ncbi:hypothetical protein CDAR_549211, partial [Caerostris darwini]
LQSRDEALPLQSTTGFAHNPATRLSPLQSRDECSSPYNPRRGSSLTIPRRDSSLQSPRDEIPLLQSRDEIPPLTIPRRDTSFTIR